MATSFMQLFSACSIYKYALAAWIQCNGFCLAVSRYYAESYAVL